MIICDAILSCLDLLLNTDHDESVAQLPSQRIIQSFNTLLNQPFSTTPQPMVNQSVIQSTNQSVNQSINQSINSIINLFLSTGQPIRLRVIDY